MTTRYAAAFAIASLLAATAALAARDDRGNDVCGLWATEGGKAHVEIFTRGDLYFGKIVWLKIPEYPADDPKGMAGQTKVDRENPVEGLRKRPLVGLEIVRFFKYDGDGKYKGGAIYDPENGKTYKCKMELKEDGTLHVRGFIGVSLLGRTTTWTRLPAEEAPASQ